MFNRIRYAVKVLSYSAPTPPKAEQPDILFVEEDQPLVNKVSFRIATFVEFFVVSVVIGVATVPVIHALFPAKEKNGLATITGIAAALLAFIGRHFLADLEARIRLNLRLSEKIAPYVGHKITRTLQILRG
jgi:hypothetical protein